MIRIQKVDWDRVHELACEIVNASVQSDDILTESKTEALFYVLEELKLKYGPSSRITATIADYTEENREPIYQEALRQARLEGDKDNELIILESIQELQKRKTT